MSMSQARIQCDACGRRPRFWEWARAELTLHGYGEWHHPGIVFRRAGLPFTYDNRARCAQYYFQIFGRQLPDELSYLCPECCQRVLDELPELMGDHAGLQIHREPPPLY